MMTATDTDVYKQGSSARSVLKKMVQRCWTMLIGETPSKL